MLLYAGSLEGDTNSSHSRLLLDDVQLLCNYSRKYGEGRGGVNEGVCVC